MNLKELKMIVDSTIENLRFEKPENVQVLITLSEMSMGPRASIAVRTAYLGFDWEHNQFRIEPVKALVTKGNNLTDTKSAIFWQSKGRKYYFCPSCHQNVAKNDYYCRHCGQKLK
jgi:hypothetical protein